MPKTASYWLLFSLSIVNPTSPFRGLGGYFTVTSAFFSALLSELLP